MSLFSAPTQIPLPQTKVDNIFYVLRQANAHVARVATDYRNSFKPTHHARKHAHFLGLSISTQAASKLDQRQISAIPLPILDLAPSSVRQVAQESQAPTEAPVITITEVDAAPPSIVAPLPRYPSNLNSLRVKEIKRPVKPVLHCVVPTKPIIVDIPENAISPYSIYLSASTRPRRGMTSKWSASTTNDIEAEEDEQEDDDMPEDDDVPQPTRVGVKYASGYDESLDILVSPDDIQEVEAFATLRPRIAVNGSARARISFPPMARDFQFDLQPQHKAAHPPLPTRIPTRIPRHVAPQRVELDLVRQALSSGSDSSQSPSVGVITPLTSGELPKLMIRFKRKSLIDDMDIDHVSNDRAILEKRPKYERKPWVTPSERRGHQRNASWSCRGKYI